MNIKFVPAEIDYQLHFGLSNSKFQTSEFADIKLPSKLNEMAEYSCPHVFLAR